MFNKIYILILLALLIIGASACAGTFTPTPSSPGASYYTLSDIYNKISAGTSAPAHTFDPATTPAETFVTLSQIWNIIPPHRTLATHDLDSGILPAGIYSATTSLATIEPNLIAANIATGTSIFGIVGTYVPAPLITVPGAPTEALATSNDNSRSTISFTPPASDGGSPILYYTVTYSPGDISTTTSSTNIMITGLTNNTTYTFNITATNAIGTSAASNPPAVATPASVPIVFDGIGWAYNITSYFSTPRYATSTPPYGFTGQGIGDRIYLGANRFFWNGSSWMKDANPATTPIMPGDTITYFDKSVTGPVYWD